MFDLRVLIVDDDKITTTILMKMIQPLIRHVHLASDGEEGFRLYQTHRPDIVLSDINMPGMSGLEMIEKIRAVDTTVKIAIFTNFDNKFYLIEAIRLGVNQFFCKPFEKEHFLRVVTRMSSEIMETRTVAEKLKRRENMLGTINKMAENFLQQSSWHGALTQQMLALKAAAEVSALFIYQNDDPSDPHTATQYLVLNDHPGAYAPRELSYKRFNIVQWQRMLAKGEPVSGSREDFGVSKQKMLDAFKISTMLMIPIYTDHHWWGFVGLGNSEERPFEDADINTLMIVGRMIGSAIDNQHQLRSLEMTSAVFQHTVDGVVITDAQNNILHINEAFTEITGFSADDVRGKNPKVLRSSIHDKKFFQIMWNHINQFGFWQGEIKNRKKNGEIYIEWLSINAIRNSRGEVENYIGVFSDVTAHRHDDMQNAYLATHDTLTGLTNRVLLHDRLKHAIMHAERFDKCVAVIFCDLDNFKPINDTYGHIAGDEVLKRCAGYFKSILRGEDTICRYGGDEFIIVLEGIEDLHKLSSVTHKIMALTEQSFSVEGQSMSVQMSAGIALYPEDGLDSQTLIQNADEAMYSAKKSGKNRLHYHKGVQSDYCHFKSKRHEELTFFPQI